MSKRLTANAFSKPVSVVKARPARAPHWVASKVFGASWPGPG
jgi:hypothetical protein